MSRYYDTRRGQVTEHFVGSRTHGLPWIVIDADHDTIVASFRSESLAARIANALNDLEATV